MLKMLENMKTANILNANATLFYSAKKLFVVVRFGKILI